MISAKLNQADVNAFLAELNTFANNIRIHADTALTKAGNETYDMIRSNIGTHSPYTFTTIYGESWRPLDREWIYAKETKRATIEKWAETGEIEASVRRAQSTNPRAMFVGIDRDDSPDAYDKSIMNEFSHKRPLFTTVGNKVAADMGKGAGTINEAFKRVIADAVKNTWGT